MAGRSKHEVFLGGSCNPTTWRADVAIPTLEKMGITYYNPQVADWRPELVELENQAKENANVLFFVIDNQTRSVVSTIEVAHTAGTQRKLVVVIYEFSGAGAKILGEVISKKKEEYEDLKHGQKLLKYIMEWRSIPTFNDIPNALACVQKMLQGGGMLEKAEGSQAGKGLKSKGGFKSIYLGGSASTSKWRENIAIPILKKHGIKYSSPQKELWKENLILSASENNELLLFVITKDTRSVAEMTLASYYIGLGCPMVMCIQSLDADAEIDGEKQSGQAVKDYNRGRVYLLDLAKSAGVPVFDDIMQAVNSTAEKYLAASK